MKRASQLASTGPAGWFIPTLLHITNFFFPLYFYKMSFSFVLSFLLKKDREAECVNFLFSPRCSSEDMQASFSFLFLIGSFFSSFDGSDFTGFLFFDVPIIVVLFFILISSIEVMLLILGTTIPISTPTIWISFAFIFDFLLFFQFSGSWFGCLLLFFRRTT